MEITYTLTYDDLKHFQAYYAKSKPLLSKIKAYAWKTIALALLSYKAITQYSPMVHSLSGLSEYFWSVGMPLLVYLAFLVVPQMISNQMLRKSSTASQQMTIRLTKSVIEIRSASVNKQIPWEKLYDIARDTTHSYFFISKTHAYIVPNRIFENNDRAYEFYQAALTYRVPALDRNEEDLEPYRTLSLPSHHRQIRYTVSQSDREYCTKFIRKTRSQPMVPASIFKTAVSLIVGVGMLGSLGLIFAKISGTQAVWGTIVGIVLIGSCACVIVYLNDLIKNAKNSSHRSALQTLTLELEHVIFSSENARVLVRWSDLCDLQEDQRMVYFFTSERYAYFLPRAAFNVPEDAREFYETARACWESAKAGTPLTELPKSQCWPPPPVAQ